MGMVGEIVGLCALCPLENQQTQERRVVGLSQLTTLRGHSDLIYAARSSTSWAILFSAA